MDYNTSRPEIKHAEEIISVPWDPDMDDDFLEKIYNIAQWGIDRRIIREEGARGITQIRKLQEELDELREGLEKEDDVQIVDGIGDMLVVLIQICRLEGVTLLEALDQAWSEIKDRKGRLVNGVFVKEQS